MQQSAISTLNPARSRDALSKLRASAEAEAEVVPPGVISVVSGDIAFDGTHAKVPPMQGDPNDQVGAARYSGQNSPHIGNGPGGVQ